MRSFEQTEQIFFCERSRNCVKSVYIRLYLLFSVNFIYFGICVNFKKPAFRRRWNRESGREKGRKRKSERRAYDIKRKNTLWERCLCWRRFNIRGPVLLLHGYGFQLCDETRESHCYQALLKCNELANIRDHVHSTRYNISILFHSFVYFFGIVALIIPDTSYRCFHARIYFAVPPFSLVSGLNCSFRVQLYTL